MRRSIIGFEKDEQNHWVARLDCGHGQHVRHDPPWTIREWVTTEQGRAWFQKSLDVKERFVKIGQMFDNKVHGHDIDFVPEIREEAFRIRIDRQTESL